VSSGTPAGAITVPKNAPINAYPKFARNSSFFRRRERTTSERTNNATKIDVAIGTTVKSVEEGGLHAGLKRKYNLASSANKLYVG
jgi:hypothetical protein